MMILCKPDFSAPKPLTEFSTQPAFLLDLCPLHSLPNEADNNRRKSECSWGLYSKGTALYVISFV